MYMYIDMHIPNIISCVARGARRRAATWPSHDIGVANRVCCITYKRELGGEVVYCSIVVQ